MTSHRHNGDLDHLALPSLSSADERVLDAARASIVDVGWRRSTLTDVARRAGVSRMTIYRRWPDMQTLFADLMTREFATLAGRSALGGGSSSRALIADGVASMVTALREDSLFAKVVEVDPELLLPYLFERRGRSQDALLSLLVTAVQAGQGDGSVRPGDPGVLARGVLLAAHGFAFSAATMADAGGVEALDAELRRLVDAYLA